MEKHFIKMMMFYRYMIFKTKRAINHSSTEDELCVEAEKIMSDIDRYTNLCNEQSQKTKDKIKDMVECYIDAYSGYF